MNDVLKIGTVFDDFCNGYFGRDYGLKTVVGLGDTWIVARLEDGTLKLGSFASNEHMLKTVRDWSVCMWALEDSE